MSEEVMSLMTMLDWGGAGAGGAGGAGATVEMGAGPACLGGCVLLVTGSLLPAAPPVVTAAPVAPVPRSAQFWHCWTYSRVRWYVSCRMPNGRGTAPVAPAGADGCPSWPAVAQATPAAAPTAAPGTATAAAPTAAPTAAPAAAPAAFCRAVDWLMSWHWISVCVGAAGEPWEPPWGPPWGPP